LRPIEAEFGEWIQCSTWLPAETILQETCQFAGQKAAKNWAARDAAERLDQQHKTRAMEVLL